MQNRFSILKSIKNQILVLFLFFCFQLSAQSTLVTELTGNPLNTNGWRIVRGNSLSGLVNGQEFVLTPDNTGTQSAIYYNTPFNLNQCNKWRIEFEYRIWGNGTPSYGNGDGMAFWYLDNPPQNFVGGGEIGIPSNAKGIMMIMDTFDNDTEGPNNEFQILYGQNYNTGRNPNITKFNTQDFGLNVRSNGYRPVVITWENGKVTVSINGVEIVSDFEPTIQPGVGNVGLGYFGFSASTGAASDRHSIRNVKVYMDLVEVNTKNVTLKTCDPDGDGFANFDLTSKIDEIISNPENYQINYYNNLDDLTNEENEISTPENYTNKLAFADKVYVKVKNGEDCYDIAEIDLVVNAIKLNPIATQSFCDDDFDGKILVNLKSYQNQLVDNTTDKKFSYFSDVSLTNEILESQLENFEISNFPTSVWVVVEQTFDGGICQSNPVEIKFDLSDKITINQPEINLLNAPICLEEGSSLMLDLTQKEAFYTSETSVDFVYYETKEQAILGNNDFIIDPKNYSVSTSGSVFVRLEKSGLCTNIIELKYELINQLSISNSVELPTKCDDNFDGFVEFNLDESIPLFTTDNSGLTFTYFLSQEDAVTQTNPQNAIQSLAIGDTKTFYVHVTNGSCETIVTLVINASEGLTDVIQTIDPITVCDDDFDAIYLYDLSQTETLFVENSSYQFSYFLTEDDAKNNINALSNTEVSNFELTENTRIWLIISDGSCKEIRFFDLEIGQLIQLNSSLPKIESCKDEMVNLSNYESQITLENNVNFTYFSTLLDAQNNQNALSNLFTSTENLGQIFVRLEKVGFCPTITSLDFEFYNLPTSPISSVPYLCENSSIVLDAGNEFPDANYVWATSDGQLISGHEIEISVAGNYSLEITNLFGCKSVFNYEVSLAPKPIILNVLTGIDYLIVEASTTEGTLMYSLDGINWQADSRFDHLENGKNYTVYVTNGFCVPVTKTVKIYYITNFISPNGDGKNDEWNLSFINDLQQVHIFDRYGRTVFLSDKKPFIWDGKMNGSLLESSTYWYILQLENETKIEGNIILKNK